MRTDGHRIWSPRLATPQGQENGSIQGQPQHVAEEISKQNFQRTTSDEPLTGTPPLTEDTSFPGWHGNANKTLVKADSHGKTFGFINILVCFRSLTLSLPLSHFSHPEHNGKTFTGKLAGCLPETVTQEATVYLQRGRKRQTMRQEGGCWENFMG